MWSKKRFSNDERENKTIGAAVTGCAVWWREVEAGLRKDWKIMHSYSKQYIKFKNMVDSMECLVVYYIGILWTIRYKRYKENK